MDLDVEIAHKASGKSRFEKWLAIAIGAAAIVAALLATLEMHSNKRWEQASTEAADLSVELFGKIAASGPARAAGLSAEQMALALGLESGERSSHPQAQGGSDVVRAYVDGRVGERLLKLAKDIQDPPDESSGVDAVAREAVAADVEGLDEIRKEQNEHVEEAESYGTRLSRALFALSLLAFAAILLGLAAVLGVEHGGFITLGVATGTLVLATAWGASALFA